MHQIDYTGAHGGQLAMAFAAGVTFSATILLAAGGFIWRVFGDGRIKELKTQLSDERARCDDEIDVLRDRVKQLETLLIMHGPPLVRRGLQTALEERQADPAATE